MDPSTSAAAALKLEIARLSGAIDRHKSTGSTYSRNNSYPSRPWLAPASNSTANPASRKDVVIGGVAFESSRRSLVRKDLATSTTTRPPTTSKPPTKAHPEFARTRGGHLIKTTRIHKPKPIRARGGPNMTLTNSRRPYQPKSSTRRKYVDKPCPRFTTTGACSRGLTCMYQHDPSKIAICWNFLQGSCPNSPDTCNLSHDPTPERTPPCMHFANNGRCHRDKCPFPHVRLGARQGVCRDFAVLGYCDKGLECDKQHARECPDFAENGTCTTKGCKLPHVIRANRNRKSSAQEPSTSNTPLQDGNAVSSLTASDTVSGTDHPLANITASDAKLGDEFISLTFHESDESSEESDSEDDQEEDEVQTPSDDEFQS